jgi:hypothetical protein
MRRNIVLTIGSLALGIALALPAAATPGRGNGNGGGNGPERDPDEPGRNGPPISAPGQAPDFTPPGLGGNPPPGHGGPNPGNGNGGEARGNKVPRGQARICEDGAVAVGPLGQSGASHVAHVNFEVAEDSDSTSWARMMYFWIGSTFDFVLNAHDLEAGSEWTLVARAADDSAICLADGTVNPGGQLHLRDSIELDSHLPDDLDPFEATPEGEDPVGAALELVPSDDVDCDTGAAETDDEDALASEHDIRFVDVEEVTCPE